MAVIEMAGICVLLICLCAAAYTDIKKRRIPNALIVFMIIIKAVFIIAQALLWQDREGAAAVLVDSLIGFLLGGGVFFAAYLHPVKSLGGGDVKLMASVGLYVGADKVLITALISMCAALAVSAVCKCASLKKQDGIWMDRAAGFPLAPFIFFGTAVSVFCL